MVSKKPLQIALRTVKQHAHRLDDLPDQSPDDTATYLLTTAALSRPLSTSSAGPNGHKRLESRGEPTPYEHGLQVAIHACTHGNPGVHTISTSSRRHPLQIARLIILEAISAINLATHYAAKDIAAHNYKHGVRGAKAPKGDHTDD